MLRIVAQEGQAVVGRETPGRGCYLCREQRCAEQAVKSGQFARALKGRARNPQLAEVLGWLPESELPLA